MKIKRVSFLVASFFFCTDITLAYEQEVHVVLTAKAVEESILNSIDYESSFGVTKDQVYMPRNPQNLFERGEDSDGVPAVDSSAALLVEYGSEAEDHGVRPLNHFLDPQNGNRPINLIISKANSADWSLEDRFDEVNGQAINLVSYKDALRFYLEGLTEQSSANRIVNLGLMFQSLGHTVHHIQDMAQPQHVRNDAHCNTDACNNIDTASLNFVDIYEPSFYERISLEELNEETVAGCR